MNGFQTMRQLMQALQMLVPIGVGARVIYCLCQIPLDEEQAQTYKRRIRNALVFLVLAETLLGLAAIVEDYFPNGIYSYF